MKVVDYVSYLLIPILIIAIILHAQKKKVPIYDNFIEGVKEGGGTVLKIFPTILAIIVAITVFRESGALALVIRLVQPITSFLGIPEEVLPLGFMSSVSGGASLGILADTLGTYGPDSTIGKMASTILGSSETTLYVLAVYTAAAKVKDTRGALWIGLVCDAVALYVAVIFCR
ncbi:MAG: spore maturation protein [Clostridia bacterium]|nr:spore maturation protein [Clostridia bacterium]